MQRTALGHVNNQKSDIRFIRSVAAPKQTHPLKVQSAVNIQYASSSNIIPPSFSLFVCLTLPDEAILNIVFNYFQATKVCELVNFIKSKINMDLIYLLSDNMLLDYFLTLSHRPLSEITTSKLHLRVHPIKIEEKLSLRSVQILKCIGSGGFSKVLLARVAGILMAVKFIDKQFIFKTAKQSIVQNEKMILQSCEGHPFITKLFFSLQTNKYIVLGLQFCNGGQLFNLLRKVKKMKQFDAKFYFVETLMAIDHLHSKGILYRDLKPQNIIIDADGHVRLADFGLSKVINRSLTYSFCGSAQYMSPQMLLKKGHGYEVDYYCLGALLYQLVTGLPPFYTHNQNQLFSNILNKQLTFPAHAVLSSQLKSFLSKILQKQPEKRFQNIDQIVKDPWMASDFNKEAIMNKKLIPPYPTAIFNYNFDDGQFSGHQPTILKLIERETQLYGCSQIRFNDIYYQSKEIIDIKKSIEENHQKNFMKVKSQTRNQVQSHSRQNSIHSFKPQHYRSSQKLQAKKYPRIDAVQSATISTSATPQISKKHVRSTQNLQTFLQRYSQEKDINKSSNIYTNKPRFSPSTTLKNYKTNNNIYNRYFDKSIDGKIDNSFSGDFTRNQYSKQKSSSLDKSYLPYRKPQQLPSYSKNFYVNYKSKIENSKVKKSYRNGQKVNFHYGTVSRV